MAKKTNLMLDFQWEKERYSYIVYIVFDYNPLVMADCSHLSSNLGTTRLTQNGSKRVGEWGELIMSLFHAAVNIEWPGNCRSVGGPFVFSECGVIPRLFITDLKEAFCHSAKWFHLFIVLLCKKPFVKQFSCVFQVSHCVKSHKFDLNSGLKFKPASSR